MPIYDVQAADGKIYSVEAPEGTPQEQIFAFVQSQMGQINKPQPQPQEGIGAALTGGFKRFLSTGETALESIINPELAARRGQERAQQIGEQYAPGASLEKVKQAYEQRGLFPAVGEAISQIPAALAEQSPQIAATLGAAKAGALAGGAFGPVGSLVGGIGAAAVPSLIQLYGANLERQAEEKAPEISRTAALGAAVPGAALEVASTFIPLGRGLIGKLLGPNAEKALARGSNEAIERAARESVAATLAKGTITGSLAEIPTEVAQQMLERYQAGLDLTGEDALKEYGEAAYGAGLVGGPFGAGARALGRSGVREEAKRIQEEEARQLAVTDEELAQRFPETLPGGFKIQTEELGREMTPVGFNIMAEGRDTPLAVVDTAEEAQAKVESLSQIREQERAKLLEEEQKINTEVEKAQARLEQLEATEQADTEEYRSLKADLPNMMEQRAQKIEELYGKVQSLGQPLTAVPFGETERVNQQFTVLSPESKPLGSFKTMGEAEAAIKEVVGEEQYDTIKRNQEVAKDLYKTFVPQMRKFGLGDVGLNIVDQIEGGKAGGSYLNKLIQVALDEDKPIQTMRHESLHAMKDLGFFTPQQWKALEDRASKEWVKTYLQDQEVEIDGQKMSRLDGYRKLGYSEQDILEEAIADAFGAYDKGQKPPPGMIAALFKRIKQFFANLNQALRGAGFQSADDIFGQIEAGRLKPAKPAAKVEGAPAAKAAPVAETKPAAKPAEEEEKLSLKPSTWKADKADLKQAEEYFDENGIMPYTSEGQIEVPLEGKGTKFSIKKPYDQKAMSKDQTLKNDPLTGLPMNANGTVTLYFPTDNAGARDLAKTKRLKGANAQANRVYLTNESSAAAVQAKPGMIDQPLGGANVLLQVDPSLLHVLEEYDDGRKDFFIPIAEGEYFAKKMAQTKLFTLNAPRTKGLHPDRTLAQVTKSVNDTADKWAKATKAERAEMARDAKTTLREQHNIEKLFGANSKLEKTNIGDYGLTYNGKKVMSTGLGFASAQKINDEQRATTCPQSGICEDLCLGETSGQNLLYGGEGEFRSGPRLSQFLKTEALVVNPEAFAVMLIKQIENFRNAAKKLGYQPAIRLNVTSDFNPKMFENVINMFPDVMFYDYTKLDTKPIAPNHHLTYSSTGASQVVNGETVLNKFSNWDRMVDKVLSNGKNVAMAFTSRNDMPKEILDERTGKTFQVWNGDEYDARFLDPVREDGQGWIIGLTNKDNTTKPEDAAKKHNGFFLDYDKARDGDTLIIRDQNKLAGKPSGKVVPIAKLSLKAATTPAFKRWFGDSKVVDEDGKPMVVYHGTDKSFDAFDLSRTGAKTDWGYYGDGLYFTTSLDTAGMYASDSAGANILPVYLSLQNPYIWPDNRKTATSKAESKAITEELKAAGHDGIIIPYQPGTMQNAEFVAFTPNQIKSATGNIGAFSPESPDIRYSLKGVSFPTVKEAKKAVEETKDPDTKEFKQFIGASQWRNPDGSPKRFYHATAAEFFEFTPAGQSQAIFLAETPEEAETFGSIAEDRLRRQIYRALNKDDKLPFFQGIIDKAVADDKITQKQGEDFIKQAKRKMPEYGDFGDIEQETYDALLELSPNRMRIMPLYARAETPFEFDNPDHVNAVMNWVANNTQYPQDFPEKWLNGLKGRISQGLWQAIEDKRVQAAIRALGHDGFTVRENRASRKNYAVYTPNQVKSITGNLGDFSLESKDVRYSLPNISTADKTRMREVVQQRYEPGWTERVIGGLKQDYTSLRQKLLNRYERLAQYDRLLREKIRQAGGPELLADQSAESAALFSDLGAGVTASAMGIGDRQGGIPVYRNGITTVDPSVKGLVASLAPLAKYGDPEIYERYQFWAGWKRGRRLLAEGRERNYTAADAAIAQRFEAAHPEFVQVQKDLTAFNDGVVKYLVDTGVISKERGQVYTQYADYIPFYRQFDLEKTIGPNPFSGISGVKGPKALKGGDAPIGDFMENLVRNTQSAINAGLKNTAAQRATQVAMRLNGPGQVYIERLPGPTAGVGYDVYTVLEKGELVYYRSGDPVFIDALKSLNMPDLPFMGLLSAPANALRNLVTKDPGFMMANLLRDSLSSYVTSGQNVTPIVGTMVNFGKALTGKNPGMQALFNAGIIGGYEFSQNIEQSGKSLERDLEKKAGKGNIVFKPFKSLWEGLEKGTTASDAATRMAVYERVMKETGNEAEALFRALEVMNFNRKGNSPIIRIATAAIPFFNARLQGLDLFYRASTGKMDMADAKMIQKKFWVRGMTMAALSVMYYFSVAGEDEYEDQEQETKDNNWLFPGLGIRIPIPFEVGVLFKTMPERISRYAFGNDTGEDLAASIKRALVGTFGFNPIPQTFKPLVEVATNYNFFTMRPIVGQGLAEVSPEFQVGPGTSRVAEKLGAATGLSPMKIDQLIKGYTGTIGGYVTDLVDVVLDLNNDSPKAAKRFEQLPIVKRFALDPEARGSVTQFYEMQKAVDTTVRTMNLLERSARPEDFAKFVQDNLGPIAVKDYVRDLEKSMKDLRGMKQAIQTASMSGQDKQEALTAIGQAEKNLTRNIQTVKKAISELK